MNTDSIAEVAIDDDGRLIIIPSSHSYPMIYREAVEVHWDAAGRFLYSPKPREWNYLDWFKHIIDTAGDLAVDADTIWKNIPADLRAEAETWIRQRK